jgi:surface protein
MRQLFYDCSSLKSLNLSNFITNNVTDMREMFNKCSSFQDLDISNFNTEKVYDMIKIFDGLKQNIKIKTKDQKLLNLINKIKMV